MSSLDESEISQIQIIAEIASKYIRNELRWKFNVRNDLVVRKCSNIESELIEELTLFIMENKA